MAANYKKRRNYRNKKRSNNAQKSAANYSTQTNLSDYVTMPASFARSLMKQIIYNSRNTSGFKRNTYSLQTKEDILDWLKSPSTNEQSLRNASNLLYLQSSHYRRLITYYAGLYTGAYVILPSGFNPSTLDGKDESFKKNYYKAAKLLEALYIKQLMFNTFLVALREGAYYGALWSDNTSTFIQRIDADYCKITSVCDGVFLYSVDMSKLRGKLEYYPDAFSQMYQNYMVTGEKWQEVPVDISFCIKGDSSILDSSIPIFAATMPELYTIANTQELQETADEIKNYKMVSGEVPTDDRGRPLMDEPTVRSYYQHISNGLGDNIGLALTPFKLSAITFNEDGGVADVDNISKAVKNFWSSAGTSGLLHGGENDTAGVTKLAIKNDETFMLDFVEQFNRLINRYLKVQLTGTCKFKTQILPVTVFNKEEYIEYYKTSASLGIGKSYYAATLGISQLDMAGLEYLEERVMPFDKLQPLKSSYNTSSTEEAGRPQLSDTDLSNEGESTRDNDTNANR